LLDKKRKEMFMGKRKRMAICEFCKNLIATGEGDFLCCECGEPVVVISNYISTKDYLKCRNSKFKKTGRQTCA